MAKFNRSDQLKWMESRAWIKTGCAALAPNMRRNLTIIAIIIGIALFVAALLNVVTQHLRFVVVRSNLQVGQGFSAYEPVTFEFNKPLTDNFSQSCTLTTTPEATFEASYKDSLLSFTPQTMYQPEVQYQAQLKCYQSDFLGQFTTLPLVDSTEEDLKKAQTELDFGTGQAIQRVLDEKPWIAQLPLEGQYYTLIYSQQNNDYIVQLSIPAGSTTTRDQVETQIKSDLQKIGAPTDLPITYTNWSLCVNTLFLKTSPAIAFTS